MKIHVLIHEEKPSFSARSQDFDPAGWSGNLHLFDMFPIMRAIGTY